MIFDTHMWGLALFWAALTSILLGGTTYLSNVPVTDAKAGRRAPANPAPRGRVTAFAFIAGFVLELLVMRFVLYYITPALVGALGGLTTFFVVSLLVGGVTTMLNGGINKGNHALPTLLLAVVFLVTLIVPATQHFIYGTGLTQARFFASLPDVKVVDSSELPPTDPNHLIMVPRQVAVYKGSSVIGTTGDNLGSIFQTNANDYTLQSVAGHLYWIAPLDYSSMWNQVGIFATAYATTPGFVAVDAENPDAPAVMHLKDESGKPYALKYLPDAVFSQNLTRLIYMSGYTDGTIEDPTLEVDDHWRPFYSVTYLKPAAGGVSGSKIDSILLVDAQTGEITRYAPDKVPAWVDRVMSYDLVKEYADDWGAYEDQRHSWYWFGNSQFQSHPTDIEVHYQMGGAQLGGNSIWVMPFTSSNSNDASSLGVMVVDTHDNTWSYYKGFAGKPVGQPVLGAFTSFPMSPVRINNLSIESIQLYSIYGHATWVAIYTRPVGVGSAFAGIAFLDAQDPQPANVVFGENRESTLANYRSYLAGDHQPGSIAHGGQPSKPVSGIVSRIGASLVNGQWLYSFTINGDKHIYQTGGANASPELPLVHAGDAVSFTFLDTNERVEAIGDFHLKADAPDGK